MQIGAAPIALELQPQRAMNARRRHDGALLRLPRDVGREHERAQLRVRLEGMGHRVAGLQERAEVVALGRGFDERPGVGTREGAHSGA